MAIKRILTNYPGVFYREGKRIGGNGTERIYYIVFKKDGKLYEEKVGRQYADDMTPPRASKIRADRIEGKRLSRREIKAADEARKNAELNKWTIQRLWDEYSAHRGDSKSFRTDKNRFENYLKEKFSALEPRELIHLEVERLRVNLLKKKSPQTVKHILALLKRIINFGVDRGLCEGPPFKIQLPKVYNQKTEDLTPEQLESLLKAIDDFPNIQAGNIMKMVLYTGMRRGELFKLKWEDIDFHRGFIFIRDPKGGPSQKIPLNEAARQLLENHPWTESEYVFPGRDGNMRVDINHQVRAIANAAGLPKDFRPLHGLRHVYASMLASSGQVDMYTLQKLLTHKNASMTQRYAHLRDETLQKASNLAGDIIDQVTNRENKKKVVRLKKGAND